MTERTLHHRVASTQRAPSGEAPAERVIPMIASSAAVDSYDEIVDQDTWQLARFAANPIALRLHRPWEDPVGFWRNVRVEGGALRGDLVLYDAATSPEAEKIWQRYLQGGPVACSVGFYPGRTEKRVVDGVERKVLLDCELEEISVVTIPANPEAVAEMRRRAAKAAHQRRHAPAKTHARKGSMDNLKTYLEAGGIDPAELAAKAGMDPDTMLSGKMTDEQKTALAAALGMDLDELVAMLPAMEPEPTPEPEVEAAPSAEEVKALLAALGARTVREAQVKVRALSHVRDEAGPLAQRVKALEAERETERREAALAEARRSGVLTPAREKGAVGTYLRGLKSAAEVRSYLGTLTPAVPTEKPAEKPAAGAAAGLDVDVDDASIERASKASGIPVEVLKRSRDAIAERRRAERV